MDLNVCAGLNRLRVGSIGGLCELGNSFLGLIKGGEFLEQLTDFELVVGCKKWQVCIQISVIVIMETCICIYKWWRYYVIVYTK